jgi:hypothetical protein
MTTRYWSEHEVATLLRMREQGSPAADIACAVGRSESCLWRKLRQMRKAAARAESELAAGLELKRPMRLWRADELEMLHRMRAEGHLFTDIDRALGRGIGASSTKFSELHPSGVVKAMPGVDGAAVSADLLRERDRRMSVQHHDLTAAFFGDPLPGQSALDRRKSA